MIPRFEGGGRGGWSDRRNGGGNVRKVHVLDGLEVPERNMCALNRIAADDGISVFQAIRDAIRMYVSEREG